MNRKQVRRKLKRITSRKDYHSVTTKFGTLTVAAREIVKASRCIIQGKAVLMGFDADGKEVFGRGAKPKNIPDWCRQGSNADLKAIKADYAAYLRESS